MEAIHYRELLDISIVPKMKLEYYQELRMKYDGYISDTPPKLPEKPADMCIKAGSPEAKDIIFNLFRSAKRGFGHGG